MRLIPVDFGLRAGDPTVPLLEYRGLLTDPQAGVTVAGWFSYLPWEADEASVSTPLEWRAEAAVEHAQSAAGVEYPWMVVTSVDGAGVHVRVSVSGPAGWEDAIQPVDRFALDARADEIATAVWAAWHATGHAVDADQIAGILWLVGAQFDWGSAVLVAAQLAAG